MKYYRIKPIIWWGKLRFQVQEWVWYWPVWWDAGDVCFFNTLDRAKAAVKHLKAGCL